MNQEEGLMIEYLSKISEMILQMRYDPHSVTQSSSALSNGASNNINGTTAQNNRSSSQKFGFVLPKQQYRMGNMITEKWNSSCTVMTVEFFLQKKSDGTNYCIEQWQFCYEKEFALPQNSQNGNGSNSKNSLAPSSSLNKKNKKQSADMKLSILSRSIVSLLVNNPLWSLYIQSDNRSIKNAYILDYKISFSKNKPLQNATPIQFTELNLASGSLIFNCFYLKDLDKLFTNQLSNTGTQNLQNCYNNGCGGYCTNNCNGTNCNSNVCRTNSNNNNNNNNSGISNNLNSLSTANSSPNGINNINLNYYVPNFKKKHERERFLSDNLDIKDLLPQNTSNQYASTRMNTQLNKENIPSKHGMVQNQQNMTFRFSFSDNEPLSDEDKKIINHHLRQSSVVSVYSRKDDITLISTPEEIASKMCDGQANELNGLEIEMVLEEDKVDSRPYSNSNLNLCGNNNNNNNDVYRYGQNTFEKENTKAQQKSNGQGQAENNLSNAKYGGLDDKYTVNKMIPSKTPYDIPAQIIIDDDFDFQLIEEESDKPLDLAIKKLSDLINQHKVQLREQTASQSAFELYQSLTKYVENY